VICVGALFGVTLFLTLSADVDLAVNVNSKRPPATPTVLKLAPQSWELNEAVHALGFVFDDTPKSATTFHVSPFFFSVFALSGIVSTGKFVLVPVPTTLAVGIPDAPVVDTVTVLTLELRKPLMF